MSKCSVFRTSNASFLNWTLLRPKYCAPAGVENASARQKAATDVHGRANPVMWPSGRRDCQVRANVTPTLAPREAHPDASIDQPRRPYRGRACLDEILLVEEVLHADEHLEIVPDRPANRPRRHQIDDGVSW